MRANQQNIVPQLQAYTNAIGFSGADGNLIQSEKKSSHNQLRICGRCTMNTALLETLISINIVPVFCHHA
jgi:acetylglutamate kinase